MQPLVARTIGKTTFVDMRAVKDTLRASDLDWIVIQSAGLFTRGSRRASTP